MVLSLCVYSQFCAKILLIEGFAWKMIVPFLSRNHGNHSFW